MSAPPPRGAKEGIRQDVQRLKDEGEGYKAGPGTTAWTHDFLNKKPWHPLNFRNQIKRWEAEQEVTKREKQREQAQAEFEAEQQYLDTLAHLPSRDADKYRQMQGVSWMYVKPPGMAGQEHAASHQAQPSQGQNAAQQQHQQGQPGQEAEAPKRRHGPKEQWERGQGTANALQLSGTLKRRRNSPPIGGFEWGSGNQELLLDDDDGDVGGQLDLPPAATVCENHAAGGTSDGAHGNRSKHKSRHNKIKRTKARSEHEREDADTDSKHAKRHKRKHDSKHTRRRAHNGSGSNSSGSSHDSPHAGANSHQEQCTHDKSPGGQRHRRSGSRDRHQARVQAHRCQHHASRSAGQRHDRLEDALQALVAEGYDLQSLLKDR